MLTIVCLAALLALLAANLFSSGEAQIKQRIEHRYAVADPQFFRAMSVLLGPPLVAGNRVDTLLNGDEIFPAMLKAIREAKRTINFETYIYWKGDVGKQFADALSERARAGVKVHILLDWVGSQKMDEALLDEMRRAGVDIKKYHALKWFTLDRINNRTHRKLLVTDGRVGFTGGVGIAEEWTGNAQDPEHWRDTHVRVIGPVVRGLQGAFAENWLESTGDVLAGDRYLPEVEEVEDGGPMQVTRSSATIGDTNAEALLYLALAAAKRSIELTSAYFVPRPAFTDALVEAAERGVEIRILVPGSHIDKEFVRTAGRAAYDTLLAAGIEIYEYCPTMLHAKTLTVDGCWSSVGSVNFDNRSFQLHDEATLCVQSERFAAELTAQFEADLDVSEAIRPGRWADRPLHQRAAERVLTLARREL